MEKPSLLPINFFCEVVVPRPGFEPGTLDQPLIVTESQIPDFKDFCLIDLQLMKSTTRRYVADIKHFLTFTKENNTPHPRKLIRSYLKTVPNDGNALRAIKAYCKFIGREHLAKTFRFPQRVPKIRSITKHDLQKIYSALQNWEERASFLFYASSGLRKMEILSLRKNDIDRKQRIIIPKNHRNSQTKQSYISFYNEEAEYALNQYEQTRSKLSKRVFSMNHKRFCKMWREAREKTGIKISCQDLRFWFSNEMGLLGVGDRFINAYCGRVSKSIISQHYTDFSIHNLKKIYDQAGLKVLR
jgi:integrase